MRLAIVGAGPAGIYAADLIIKAERDFDVSIDLFDLLPAPYGLVRYGVAPDHPRIKGIIRALYEVLDRGLKGCKTQQSLSHLRQLPRSSPHSTTGQA